jgi:tetratricopeptide (TPR) repeat protein
MSKRTANDLFIVSSRPALYQGLLTGVATYEALGNRIVKQIKAAHAFRQVDQVRELARVLINIPIKEYQLIAWYYLVWCDCREAKYDIETLERIVEQTNAYKAKALSSRAAIEVFQKNNERAFYFYTEALKASPAVSEYIHISRAIAVLKAQEGFHKSALRDMENLIPVIRYAEPLVYYDFLNSYTIELGETGRMYEASNISRVVLSSPFIHAYPEWRETAQDLRGPNHSFIAVPLIKREPVKIEAPRTEHASKPEPESKIKPASVITFPKLKEAPQPQKPEPFTPQELSELTLSQKKELILAAIRSSNMPEGDYDKMLVMAGLLTVGPADKVLDLEDEALLDDIVVTWVNLIEPEDFAAVMSALRDCEDRIRRRDIMDRMIRIAFEETQDCGLNEEAWRLRVERRLPK